ncbi:retrovirus-related pol polyprotein from transposon TNT 1-94 [Tanacetum coccineum]
MTFDNTSYSHDTTSPTTDQITSDDLLFLLPTDHRRLKMKIVNRDFAEPSITSQIRALWERNNDMIISWILNIVIEQIGNKQITLKGSHLLKLREKVLLGKGSIMVTVAKKVIPKNSVTRLLVIEWDILHGKVQPKAYRPQTHEYKPSRTVNMVNESTPKSAKSSSPNVAEQSEGTTTWTRARGLLIAPFSLELNDTWELALHPANKVPIGCKWVFKIKYHVDGTIEIFKARLVAKGYTQQEGINYKETSAPVAKMVSARALLALAINKNWFSQNAFLHRDLHKEVYMSFPPGYSKHSPPGTVYKLKKSLYGLKQANRQWFTKLSSFLIILNFKQSYADTSLFTITQEGHTIMLLVIKYLGDLNYYLGVEFLRNSSGLTMSQRKYALDLLQQAKVLNEKLSIIPLNPTSPLNDTDRDPLSEQEASTYRTLVGKLIYLTITRPDLSFTANQLSQFSKQPRITHNKALHRVLHYIKLYPGQGLYFPIKNSLQLIAYCDSDWATCPISRRSVTGYAFFSKALPYLMDIKESNYGFQDLHLQVYSPIKILCGNKPSIALASNSIQHARIKHHEIDCHFLELLKILQRQLFKFLEDWEVSLLQFMQRLKNINNVKDFELASLFGKLKYEENLIDSIYETEKNKSLISATPLSTTFFSSAIVQDFQDSPDDEEDTRNSHEYLNDLEEEYQARALLAKSKRFYKKGTQRFSTTKATNQTECHKCGKKCHFARDGWPTKDFEAKYNKVKAKLALLSSSASVSKASIVKNKGLIAKAYEWDKEEVTELKELKAITETWLNSSNKLNQCISEQIPSQNKRIMEVDQLIEDPSSSGQKDLVFVKSSADDTNVTIPGVKRPWLSEAEGFILPNHDTSRILPAELQRNTTDPSVAVTDSLATIYCRSQFNIDLSSLLRVVANMDSSTLTTGETMTMNTINILNFMEDVSKHSVKSWTQSEINLSTFDPSIIISDLYYLIILNSCTIILIT